MTVRLLSIFIAFVAASQLASAHADPRPLEDSGADSGAAVYGSHCAKCHGTPGKPGELGPDLFAIDWTPARKAAAIEIVRDGRDGDPVDMPAFSGTLTEAEIRDVIEYVAAQ